MCNGLFQLVHLLHDLLEHNLFGNGYPYILRARRSKIAREGLFTDHMFPRVQRIHNHLRMRHRRRYNVDDVNLGIGEHLMVIGANFLVTISFLYGSCPLLIYITNGLEAHIDAADFFIAVSVQVSGIAGAHSPHTYSLFLHIVVPPMMYLFAVDQGVQNSIVTDVHLTWAGDSGNGDKAHIRAQTSAGKPGNSAHISH